MRGKDKVTFVFYKKLFHIVKKKGSVKINKFEISQKEASI